MGLFPARLLDPPAQPADLLQELLEVPVDTAGAVHHVRGRQRVPDAGGHPGLRAPPRRHRGVRAAAGGPQAVARVRASGRALAVAALLERQLQAGVNLWIER